MNNKISFSSELTETGWPSLWESGGFEDGEGYSQIIAGADGRKLKPRYIRRGANITDDDTAQFTLKVRNHIVVASYIDDAYSIQVYVITLMEKGIKQIGATQAAEFEDGKWSTPLYKDWPMIEAAKERAKYEKRDKLFYGTE